MRTKAQEIAGFGGRVQRGNKQYKKRQGQLVGEETARLRRQVDLGTSRSMIIS